MSCLNLQDGRIRLRYHSIQSEFESYSLKGMKKALQQYEEAMKQIDPPE